MDLIATVNRFNRGKEEEKEEEEVGRKGAP
jgi:hypothetical protein